MDETVQNNTVTEISQPTNEQSSAVVQETSQQINLRALRERAERAERRAYELEMAQKQSKPTEDDDVDFGEDDAILETKHLKKYHKKQKDKSTQTQAQIDAIQSTLSELRLRAKHPDIDSVVTDENLDKLKRIKPSIWRSIMANPDMVDRGEVAHDAISTWVAPKRSDDHVERRLEENKSKPRPVATAGAQTATTPLSQLSNFDRRVLTEEDKQRIMRHTNQAIMGG
jgi:hypothetical protein